MSNMAAGATVGSNHNSRSNDGEIRAGRGFWPGLSATLKHSCVFGSFIIISKGDYPYELNIRFPFSLINNNLGLDRLEVMPAYFWMHNLYALERNSWKTIARDRRKIKKQFIEADYLTPDTAEEIIAALDQMEFWMNSAGISIADFIDAGDILPENKMRIEDEPMEVNGMERHIRRQVLLKPRHAWIAYRQMLFYYAMKTLVNYLEEKPDLSYNEFINEMAAAGNKGRIKEWVNLGGQIVPAFRVDKLREQIRQGAIDTWDGIHASYDEMAVAYNLDRARHAWEIYRYFKGNVSGSESTDHPLMECTRFREELKNLIRIHQLIAEQVYNTRAKDYNDPFRAMTYRNSKEMDQVLGKVKDNSFVKLVNERTKQAEESLKKLSERLG